MDFVSIGQAIVFLLVVLGVSSLFAIAFCIGEYFARKLIKRLKKRSGNNEQ